MEKSIKKNLQSLDNYIAIGFDADHCLVRYRLYEFFSMFYKRIAQVLVDKHSYPSEMLEFGKREQRFILNGLVVDYKTAFILKLGENKVILRAYYGYDPVPQEDLEKIYGSPPKFEILDPYTCRHEDYLCCVSFFECFFPPLLAHMIAYKKKTHHLEDINARKIFDDLFSTYLDIWEEYGMELSQKLDDVIYKQDKIKGILKNLREKGIILFVVSNGPPIYLSLIMEHAYGKDWNTLFDFIVPDSQKPYFFSKLNTPFYLVDMQKDYQDYKQSLELKKHKLYVGGNATTLEKNIKRINGGKSGRILFFGDHYSTDVLAAEKIEHWDAVCIMEELEGVDFGEDYDESCWGHWQYEDTAQGRVHTFWYSYMRDNVATCTSFIDSDEMLNFFEGKEKMKVEN